jgi:probable rRNA maturation factor
MVRVVVANISGRRPPVSKTILAYVRRVLRREGVRNARVSVVFVDSRTSRHLNRRYLKRNYSTDVLAFLLDFEKNLEGEIYVNLDRARQQAHRYEVSFANEIARLVIHGTLHLAGYDDARSKDAKTMERMQESHVAFWFGNRR